MALDEPSAQLQLDLRAAVQSALATRRPLLHHLNQDTSWLLQIPRPDSAVRHGARFYYNILIDPWFRGSQTDLASWFSQQFHAVPSAVNNVAELEELAREIEILASGLRLGRDRKSNVTLEVEGGHLISFIDAVAISHEFTDHCHKDTLLEVHPDVPVFTTKEAAKLIESWEHFRTVVTIPTFGAESDDDWRSTCLTPLPDWIGISRLLQTKDVLSLHSALMITWNNRHHNRLGLQSKPVSGRKQYHSAIEIDEDEDSAEALIYTPHGVKGDDLSVIPAADPPIHTLALLHGLHSVQVGSNPLFTALQTNLGAHNGLKAQRILRARYWIGTHDEVKKGTGLVAWFINRKVISIGEALAEERKARTKGALNGNLLDEDVIDAFDGCNWVDLRSGESRVLV